MRAGLMDRLITFQETSENSNDWNDPRDVTWSNLASDPKAWAEMIIERGNESAQSGKETAKQVVRWKVRHRTDITAQMRIVYDSTNYYVTEPPREIGRGKGLEIITERR